MRVEGPVDTIDDRLPLMPDDFGVGVDSSGTDAPELDALDDAARCEGEMVCAAAALLLVFTTLPLLPVVTSNVTAIDHTAMYCTTPVFIFRVTLICSHRIDP